MAIQKNQITPKSVDISKWYVDVVGRAKLADYSDVKGSMIIRPNGYALWENMQAVLDGWFKAGGVQNVYFPLLIPYHLLKLEEEHLKGFSPELALVTHAGGEELSEPLVIRPTSETVINQTIKKWIQSHRDLPLLLNQWCNVMRWEKRTYPFLRTSEFLWQEGHTAHATARDANEMALQALNWYQKFYEDYLALSPYVGLKSEGEKFPGAKITYSVELVMPNGKALQAATSHDLSDNFAKVFDITYADDTGELKKVFQTSWGLSTRAIGGLILAHGDDNGLVLPPKIAPSQVVLLVIGRLDDPELATLRHQAAEVVEELQQMGIRAILDDQLGHSVGYRINEWELQGVPLRLELGKKELESKTVGYARRDTLEKGSLGLSELTAKVPELLDAIQADLFTRSQEAKVALTTEASTYQQFQEIMKTDKKFIKVLWCEDSACEEAIKKDTTATPRVLELENINEKAHGVCFHCGKPAQRHWLFAQSY